MSRNQLHLNFKVPEHGKSPEIDGIGIPYRIGFVLCEGDSFIGSLGDSNIIEGFIFKTVSHSPHIIGDFYICSALNVKDMTCFMGVAPASSVFGEGSGRHITVLYAHKAEN